MSILKILFISAIHFFLFSCRSGRVNTENLNQDFYFSRFSVQIQGRALLPEQPGKSDNNYLTVLERKEICKKDALLNAHSRWLSLTWNDPQDPAEWLKRLELGAVGPWDSCLKKARILNTFYDDIRSCRVVLLYSCLPRRY